MLDKKEQQYQALASWLMYRLDGWRNHREQNYSSKWDEYYRLWRGIWSEQDRTRTAERSRIISPALQQAVESSVAELEEATFGRGVGSIYKMTCLTLIIQKQNILEIYYKKI